MQADLEGRRATQLWQHEDTGNLILGADGSSRGTPVLFSDSPTSFDWNVGLALQTRGAPPTGTAMPGIRKWPVQASEGTLEL